MRGNSPIPLSYAPRPVRRHRVAQFVILALLLAALAVLLTAGVWWAMPLSASSPRSSLAPASPVIPMAAPLTVATPIKPPDAFTVVMIDAKTERELGKFPYDRSIYARAIEHAAKLGARGVVLKLFIDRPKTAAGDKALADAMRKTKVILQARLNDAEPEDNPLPERFQLDLEASANHPISAREGWMPLPAFSAAAHDIGFSEYTDLRAMPVVERFRDKYVKSLFTCCLELATGKRAQIVPGKSMKLDNKSLSLNDRDEAPVKLPESDALQYTPLVDFLNGTGGQDVKDKLVILAYDGDRQPPVETPIGMISGHRLFCYFLFSLYEKLR